MNWWAYFGLPCFSHRAKNLLRKQRNLPGAIQIGHQDIAVARSHSLDIYSMDSVMSVLSTGMSAATTGAVRPFQSLAYPSAWTGSGLTFIPNRPPWLRSKAPREGDIYLTLTEDDVGYSVALVAHKETERGAGEPSYEFERPYYLFGPEDHWIAALSWGDSARRAVSVIGEVNHVLLCGISIPSGGDPLDDQCDNMHRIVARWRIPHGEKISPDTLLSTSQRVDLWSQWRLAISGSLIQAFIPSDMLLLSIRLAW